VIVFSLMAPFAFGVFLYRSRQMTLIAGLWNMIKWTPFFVVFFSGMSFHVGNALLARVIGYNSKWTSTAKELENSTFFKELPKVFKVGER
jgi:hypothetical protein